MRKATQMLVTTFCMLSPAVGFADDNIATEPGANQPVAEPQSVYAQHVDIVYSSRWRSYYPLDSVVFSDDLIQPNEQVVVFDFQDNSLLARASKLRGLSLVTLASFGHSRVYLGVNHDGLVGLHFNSSPRHGNERYLELSRMPYLASAEPKK